MKILSTMGKTMFKTVVVIATLFLVVLIGYNLTTFIHDVSEERARDERADYVGSYYGVSYGNWEEEMSLHEDGDISTVGIEVYTQDYLPVAGKIGEYEVRNDGFDMYYIKTGIGLVAWVDGDGYDDVEVDSDVPITFTKVGNYFYGPSAIYYGEEKEPFFNKEGVSSETIYPEDPGLSEIDCIEFKSDKTFTLQYEDKQVSGTYRLDGKVLYLDNLSNDEADRYVFIYDEGNLYDDVYEKRT